MNFQRINWPMVIMFSIPVTVAIVIFFVTEITPPVNANAIRPTSVLYSTMVPPVVPENTNIPLPVATQSVLLCGNTNSYIGKFVSCQIPKAYCTYQPDTSGRPTFCNDAPYPNNNFTLVVWGSDFSSYNGRCIIVSGLVDSFKGKPQIEAQKQPQASYCP